MDNQQGISREVQLAYLGGLIDGEGCVGLYPKSRNSRTEGGRSTMSVQPCINFTNTEKVLVDHYQAILDELGVPYYVMYRAAQGRNKENWTVCVRGMKRTIKLLPHLVVWCRGKKKANAQDVLAYCESRLSDWQSAPFTDEQRELVERVGARNYGGHRGPTLRDYTRSARSSKFPG